MDADGSGEINHSDLSRYLLSTGLIRSAQEVQSLVRDRGCELRFPRLKFEKHGGVLESAYGLGLSGVSPYRS